LEDNPRTVPLIARNIGPLAGHTNSVCAVLNSCPSMDMVGSVSTQLASRPLISQIGVAAINLIVEGRLYGSRREPHSPHGPREYSAYADIGQYRARV
jgi:hypothetical protein